MLEKDDKQNDAQTAEPPKRKGPTALEAALDGSVFQMNLDALLIENESVDDDEMEVETTPVAAAKSGQADESTENNIKETKNDPAIYGAVEILLNPAMYEAVQTILFYPTKQEVAEVSVAAAAKSGQADESTENNIKETKNDPAIYGAVRFFSTLRCTRLSRPFFLPTKQEVAEVSVAIKRTLTKRRVKDLSMRTLH